MNYSPRRSPLRFRCTSCVQDLKSRKNGRRVCSACLSSRTIINIITRASAETGVEMLTAPAAARGRRAWASVGRPRRARDREREQREIAFVLPCALAGGPGALSKCSYRHIALPSKAVHLKLIFPLSNASHRRSRWTRRCPCPVWTLRVGARIVSQEIVTNEARPNAGEPSGAANALIGMPRCKPYRNLRSRKHHATTLGPNWLAHPYVGELGRRLRFGHERRQSERGPAGRIRVEACSMVRINL